VIACAGVPSSIVEFDRIVDSSDRHRYPLMTGVHVFAPPRARGSNTGLSPPRTTTNVNYSASLRFNTKEAALGFLVYGIRFYLFALAGPTLDPLS